VDRMSDGNVGDHRPLPLRLQTKIRAGSRLSGCNSWCTGPNSRSRCGRTVEVNW